MALDGLRVIRRLGVTFGIIYQTVSGWKSLKNTIDSDHKTAMPYEGSTFTPATCAKYLLISSELRHKNIILGS